ncbi:hypothetical protein DXD91_13070 [Anaerobutyricum hallii]|uniref:Uncharacterized protein n=1 Tax=Anaerobutyricum hallii TaxID=39488 RepID=A0A374NBD0_9FIRM|nr:hypothetical protein DXD91_13070 [Anaerobutyricum hallii]
MLKDLLGKTLQGMLNIAIFFVLSCFTFFLFSYISHMPHEHSLPPFFPLLYGFRQTENVYPYLFYSFLTFLQVHQPEGFGEEG